MCVRAETERIVSLRDTMCVLSPLPGGHISLKQMRPRKAYDDDWRFTPKSSSCNPLRHLDATAVLASSRNVPYRRCGLAHIRYLIEFCMELSNLLSIDILV